MVSVYLPTHCLLVAKRKIITIQRKKNKKILDLVIEIIIC